MKCAPKYYIYMDVAQASRAIRKVYEDIKTLCSWFAWNRKHLMHDYPPTNLRQALNSWETSRFVSKDQMSEESGASQRLDNFYTFSFACTQQPLALVSQHRPISLSVLAGWWCFKGYLHHHRTLPHHHRRSNHRPPHHLRLQNHPPPCHRRVPRIEEPRQWTSQ